MHDIDQFAIHKQPDAWELLKNRATLQLGLLRILRGHGEFVPNFDELLMLMLNCGLLVALPVRDEESSISSQPFFPIPYPPSRPTVGRRGRLTPSSCGFTPRSKKKVKDLRMGLVPAEEGGCI